MKTHQITLPDEFTPILAELLGPGGWESLDDLVMCGLLRSLEEMRLKDPDWMRDAVQVGVEQVERGEVVDGPGTIDRLRRKLKAPSALAAMLLRHAGKAKGLAADAAPQHDHYLESTPKR